MKVAELKGAELDHWVAKAQGFTEGRLATQPESDKTSRAWFGMGINNYGFPKSHYKPSTDAKQGMDIITRCRISIRQCTLMTPPKGKVIIAAMEERAPHIGWWEGNTPLEAAMRCKVASVYGAEVPDEVPR